MHAEPQMARFGRSIRALLWSRVRVCGCCCGLGSARRQRPWALMVAAVDDPGRFCHLGELEFAFLKPHRPLDCLSDLD